MVALPSPEKYVFTMSHSYLVIYLRPRWRAHTPSLTRDPSLLCSPSACELEVSRALLGPIGTGNGASAPTPAPTPQRPPSMLNARSRHGGAEEAATAADRAPDRRAANAGRASMAPI